MLFKSPKLHNKPTNGCEYNAINKRNYMEDRNIIAQLGTDIWLYMILDGHGGSLVAEHISKNLPLAILNGIKAIDDIENLHKLTEAIESVFLTLDNALFDTISGDYRYGGVGSTATGVLITSKNIFSINLGDSRVVLYGNKKIVGATTDHNATLYGERSRITRATLNMDEKYGIQNKRVTFKGDGKYKAASIGTTRGFGDYQFKITKNVEYDIGEFQIIGSEDNYIYAGENSAISPVPEIKKYDKDSVLWILLASDGLFDVFYNDEGLKLDFDKGTICKDLFNRAMEEGSKDNISIMVIKMNSNIMNNKEIIDIILNNVDKVNYDNLIKIMAILSSELPYPCVHDALKSNYYLKETIGTGRDGRVDNVCKGHDCKFALKSDDTSDVATEEGTYAVTAGHLGIGPHVYDYGFCKNPDGSAITWILMDRIQGNT